MSDETMVWTFLSAGTCKDCGTACEWWQTAKGSKMLIEPDPQHPYRGEGDEVSSSVARVELYPRNHFNLCQNKRPRGEAPREQPASKPKAQPAAGPSVLWRLYSALTLYQIGGRPIQRVRIGPKGVPEISEAERRMLRNVARIEVVEDPSIDKGFFRIDPDWREGDAQASE